MKSKTAQSARGARVIPPSGHLSFARSVGETGDREAADSPTVHIDLSTMTKVESRGLFKTLSSSSLVPLMSAAFSSAVTEDAPGLVPRASPVS
jgi:hypothetical protein